MAHANLHPPDISSDLTHERCHACYSTPQSSEPMHSFNSIVRAFASLGHDLDQDSLNATAGGNLLEKSPQDALTIIKNKSKVYNSRSKPIASPINACDNHSSSEIAKLTHAVNQQTSAVTTVMTSMLKQLQSNTPPGQVKAVEEICVTCGGGCSSVHISGVGSTNKSSRLARSVLSVESLRTESSPWGVTDIESGLREIEFLLYQGEDSYLKDSIDQTNLANIDDLFVDPTPEMFTDEHAPDYSFSPRFNVYPNDLLDIESDADNFYDNPFDSKGEKIKKSKLLIDQLDLPCDILPYSEYDSFVSQDFSRDDDLPLPDNEDKVFNPGILIHKKSVTIITRVAQEKKLEIYFAFLVFEDFDPPFYELLVFKEVPNSMRLLLFSSENEEKVFKPGIYTSEKVYSCFLPELSHP
nr:hypothetical protein [Tanacetum cinerariifolium]